MERTGAAHFGTTKAWVPQVVFGTLATFLCVFALLPGKTSVRDIAILLVGGMFAWTIVEYLMHRFVFHVVGGRFGRNHIWHHENAMDPDHVAAPILMAFPIFLLLLGLFCLLLGDWTRGALLGAGLSMGYMIYERFHYWAHHSRPKSRILKYMKRYHMVHHLKDHDNYFGVTSPLWDLVFGTRPRKYNL